MPTVICQKWEESEAGWGTRPDGYSLHLTEEDRKAYISDYGRRLRVMFGDTAPSSYDRPNGTPYACDVDEQTYGLVAECKYGMRFSSNDYPGDGGKDGWVPMDRKS